MSFIYLLRKQLMVLPIIARKCSVQTCLSGRICEKQHLVCNTTGQFMKTRDFSLSGVQFQGIAGEEEENKEEMETGEKKAKIDPEKDRTKIIPPELSMKYVESSAYKDTYGDDPIWKNYRRNHKFAFAPKKTRKTCIRGGVISTGSPCPICRDEYLVIDYRNIKLLKQFISPYSDEVMDPYYTGICQKQHFQLLIAVEKARDYGYIPYTVPKRYYDYEEYYPQLKKIDQSESSCQHQIKDNNSW